MSIRWLIMLYYNLNISEQIKVDKKYLKELNKLLCNNDLVRKVSNLIKPDWNTFKSKFTENPQDNFEWFSYLLFCREHNFTFIHRYKNQAAIETDPVEIDGVLSGWQAKFYEGTLTEHKKDIVATIAKVTQYYVGIKRIYFYTNSEWGQAKGMEPQAKKDVEQYAEEKGIELKWYVKSFFESEFVVLECEEISKYFFSFEDNIIDMVQRLNEHTEITLFKINTQIRYKEKFIEVSRDTEIDKLCSARSSIVFLMGPGGNGKTAIVKKIHEKLINSGGVLYLIKAHELLGKSGNRLESLNIDEFIKYHSNIDEKYFIIDSAEKLHELEDDQTYNAIITKLLRNGWAIVYTVRDHFVEPLSYMINDIFDVVPVKIEIDQISEGELESLSEKFGFLVPVSEKLKQLICVPFYLNEYLSNCDGNEKLNYSEFKNKLWIKLIQKGVSERERFFIKFAVDRVNQSTFYIESESKYAQMFCEDSILGQDGTGYFIAHDIYEEWALEKYIANTYLVSKDIEEFFSIIGSKLPIRRSFRSWLGNVLVDNEDIIVTMVDVVLSSGTIIEEFWKDEILIALLLSNQSEMFFENAKDKLLDNKQLLMRRIAALLVTSCKEIDMEYSKALSKKANEELYLMTAPIGEGWKSFIKFTYENRSSILMENIGFVIKVLYEWVFFNTNGQTTKLAGMIALEYYEWLQDKRVFYSNDAFEKKILRIIVMSSSEIKSELKVVFDKVIENKWNHHRDPYNALCDFILEEMSGNYIASILTDELINIMKLYWTESNKDESEKIYRSNDSLEANFGLNDCYHDYYPSSPYKTPVRHILLANPNKGIDFCIWFADYVTNYYLKSRLSTNEVWNASIENSDGTVKKIGVSNRLWCAYRGSQVSPDVMESVFMALEKELLNIGRKINAKILVPHMMKIIDNSNSAIMLGVVASVVCSFPEDMFEVALRFFKDELFFVFDKNRLSLEGRFMIGGTPRDQFYINERQESKKMDHRKRSLEELFTNYALYYSLKNDTESKHRLDELYTILDKHYEELEGKSIEETHTWRMSLGRMDIRTMDIQEATVEAQNYQVYTPVFDEEVEERRLELLEENNNRANYLGLLIWSREKYEGKVTSESNQHYDENVSLVIKEFEQYLNEIERGDELLLLVGRELLLMVPAVLYRDYYQDLSEEERAWSEKILIEGLKSPYQKGYDYNAINGISYAYASLPLLFSRCPEAIVEIQNAIIIALLDTTPINAINHFSVYVIDALKKMIQDAHIDFVKSLLVKYATVSYVLHKYLQQCKEKAKVEYKPIHADKLFFDFYNECKSEINEAIFDADDKNVDISNLQPDIKSKYFQVISMIDDNESKGHCIVLAKDVLGFYYGAEKNNHRIIYSNDGFLTSYCTLMLESDGDYRNQLFEPIQENLIESDLTVDIARTMITVEDSLRKREAFWWWMNALKKILYAEIDSYQLGNEYIAKRYRKIVRTLLLAENGWNGIGEWHSLNKLNMIYYKDLAEKLYFHPDVLASLLKLVEKVGATHFKLVMKIVANMFRMSNGFEGISIESDIVQFLEITIRRFVNQNRNDIRKNAAMKTDVLVILNWLVEQESVLGYIIRDDIV